jgi:hypothetical protein
MKIIVYFELVPKENYLHHNTLWPSLRQFLVEHYNWSELPLSFGSNEGEISEHFYDPNDEQLCPTANINFRSQTIKFHKDNKILVFNNYVTDSYDSSNFELISENKHEDVKVSSREKKVEICLNRNNPRYNKWIDFIEKIEKIEEINKGPLIISKEDFLIDFKSGWNWFFSVLKNIYQLPDFLSDFPKNEVKYNNFTIESQFNKFYEFDYCNIYFETEKIQENVSILIKHNSVLLRVYEENLNYKKWFNDFNNLALLK